MQGILQAIQAQVPDQVVSARLLAQAVEPIDVTPVDEDVETLEPAEASSAAA